jgi:hypothetical protein
MKPTTRRFLKITLWCWVSIFCVILGWLFVIGIRGESIHLLSASTWYALVFAFLVAGVVALLPALLLAALVSAAVFRRSLGSTFTIRPEVSPTGSPVSSGQDQSNVTP